MSNVIGENYFSTLQVVQHSCATPISNILLNLQLLDASFSFKTQKNSNNYYYFSRAYLSAQYLKQIMTTSCANQIRKNRFNLVEALNEVINIAKMPQKKCQLLKFIEIDKEQFLTGSKIHFQEALICLINNAFQAYTKKSENKLVVLFVKKSTQNIIIKVVDGGVGFSNLNNQAHQFTNNKIDKNIHLGTGLQFVCKALRKHFNASVKFHSYPSHGSTVVCQLPLTR